MEFSDLFQNRIETRDVGFSMRITPSEAQLLRQMAENARFMLHRSLDAFTERNSRLAYETIKSDDEVDKLYNRTYRAVMNYMAANPDSFELAQRLEWAAHNLERAADRVTNMCEWVFYLATGQYHQGKELLKTYQNQNK